MEVQRRQEQQEHRVLCQWYDRLPSGLLLTSHTCCPWHQSPDAAKETQLHGFILALRKKFAVESNLAPYMVTMPHHTTRACC